jgi:GR25 family glycosyltransferase involved in LPS biosynthesis
MLVVAVSFAALGVSQLYHGGLSVFSGIEHRRLSTVYSTFCQINGTACAFPLGIASAHVINMDESKERWEAVRGLATAAKIPVERFPAVDVRGVPYAEAAKVYPVHAALLKTLYNVSEQGAVGCFFSHRGLLEHLADKHADVGDDYAHLVLEDDAMFTTNFTVHWADLWSEIESLQGGWDIVMLGLLKRSLTPVPNHFLLGTIGVPHKNFGTQAYIVRHGSIPVLLRELTRMTAPVDIQYTRAAHAGRVKWFGLTQDMVIQASANGLMKSTIRVAAPPRFPRPPGILTTHVINLDSSIARWTDISRMAQAAKMPIERFPAVDVRGLSVTNASKLLPMAQRSLNHTMQQEGPGAIGCFLSHRNLMQHLLNTSNATNHIPYAHLILEDDAIIEPDFVTRWTAVWEEIRKLRGKWDILFLGLTRPSLLPIPGFNLLHTINSTRGNHGTHAYVVRHGSLPKIVQALAIMRSPVDIQYKYAGVSGALQWFALQTPIATPGSSLGLITINHS